MKEKFVEIIDDYIEDAKKTINIIREKANSYFSNPKIQKKYVIMASVFLVLILLIAGLFNSFAYYTDESIGLQLIDARVGNMYLDDYDYTLSVFIQNEDGKYILTDAIPSNGYTYNSYNCLNNSTLVYEDGSKMASATLKEKDICEIYFDLNG